MAICAHRFTEQGVKDILITCIDNLNGFPATINTVFPQTEIRTCVVHQIRNSLKYVASKDQKAFMVDLKPVYKADTLENGLNLEWMIWKQNGVRNMKR